VGRRSDMLSKYYQSAEAGSEVETEGGEIDEGMDG
jgi:hypothetical protein